MSTTESRPQPSGEKLPKKRNPVERLVVWGGIVALLAMLAYEWNTQTQFTTSVKALEAAIRTKDKDDDFRTAGFPADDIPKYLKGTPKRTEAVATDVVVADNHGDKEQIRVMYEWPSLFKTYKVSITVDQTGKAYFVEAITTSTPEEPVEKITLKSRPNAGAPSEAKPAASGQESTAASSTSEASNDPPATKPDSPIESTAEQPGSSGK